MKRGINPTASKFLIVVVITSAIILINGCGNDSKPAVDNTAKPQSMVADVPKDDGQGVGRFRNITLAALNEKMAVQGKVVFEAKCTACHNPTSLRKVGPGLKDITHRRQPAWILNQITNPAEMTQKDSTSKALLAQYLTQMTFQDVTDEQARQILEFLRQNDGEGTEEVKK